METAYDLSGHICMVTGASGGLGSCFAAALAGAGARVVATGRRQSELERVCSEIACAGGDAHPVVMDVTDAGSVAAAFERAETRYGTVDVLVNNSGVASGKPALDLSQADWDRVIDTNLSGAWRVAQISAQRLVAAGQSGSIINIASILAYRVAGGVAPYAASKAGLLHLTQALALEWARHRIRVNAIAPGFVLTEMNRTFFESEAGQAVLKRIPQRRLGTPEDLVGPLMLLASKASGYMTGSCITVDGGHLQSTL